jgi:nicotinamide phosphoribosyltransferase
MSNYELLRNCWLRADSYKYSQFLQYPKGLQGYYGYTESRGSKISLKELAPFNDLIRDISPALGLDEHLNVTRFPFFGPQMWLKQVLSKPITMEHVDVMRDIVTRHGEPFNYDGYKQVVERHGGLPPVRISALPEGMITNTLVPQVILEATDPAFAWGCSPIETQLLRAIWYPTTVSAISYTIKQIIKHYLSVTADDLSGLLFKLHDFGMRGGSSEQTCEIGGLSHLPHFRGTDTIDAIIAGAEFYHSEMAGFSIPASEHSTMTALGPLGEWLQMQQMVHAYGPEFPFIACVSDSYNIFNAAENIWGGKLRQEVIDSGKTVVIRPDSGDPVEVNMALVEILDRKFGSTVNSKGFKVLKHVRIIQGDGVCPESIAQILNRAMLLGYSADNWAFGMGGALLQKVDRDTLKYAHKASALDINGEWVEVFKKPITDLGKISKPGKVKTFRRSDGLMFSAVGQEKNADPLTVPVWENGNLLMDWTLEEVRANTEL